MTRKMRAPWLWTNFLCIILGSWLMTSPFTFGYHSPAMKWNDVVSGALVVLFAALALTPRLDFIGRWLACFVGTWLQAAPLFFWARTPVAYVTDTLIGALVIVFTILVPMMPGMAHHMAMEQPGPEIPPGWSYNPSSWWQRAPLIATGFAGWFISRYLAAQQLGFIHTAWDPFFGADTMRVLHSRVSEMWPISDAGLGALAYTFEGLMGWMGGVTRWRSMPWMVLFFGILVIPLGLVHIALVISMPVLVGHWCTLCLAAATVMLVMIPLAVDEVFAMCQFMAQSRRAGKPFWRTFWVGGTVDGEVNRDERSPVYSDPVARYWPPMVWGVTAPWTLVASAALGVWLMAAPAVFGTSGAAADSNHLVGAVVVTVSVITMAEVLRPGRVLTALLGAWVLVAPWLLSGAGPAARVDDTLVGLVLIVCSIPAGSIADRHGGWERHLSWPWSGTPDRAPARKRGAA